MTRDNRRTLSDGSVTNSFSLSSLDDIIQYTSRWIGQPTFYPPITLFSQIPRYTSQCPSSSGRTDKGVKFTSVGLVPDLGPCGDDMGTSIGGVVELVGPYGVI